MSRPKNHNTDQQFMFVFDPSEQETDMADFPKEDWSLSIYGNSREELPLQKPWEESGPTDMTKTRGIGMRMIVYADCYLGGDLVTRRSRTDLLFSSVVHQCIG